MINNKIFSFQNVFLIFYFTFLKIMYQKEQYFINYNGVKFEIDPEIFANCSPVFKRYYDPQQIMNINSDLTVQDFEQCLPAVQDKPFQITRDNVSSLRSFATEWETPELLKKIDEFDSVNRVITDLENFQINISRNLSVDDMIPNLAQNIDILITCPQFARVPQKYMRLILENPNCAINDYHAFFKFIIGYSNLQKSRNENSVLDYIDVSRLNMSEINELFEINIISTQNPKDNSNFPELLKNLTFYLHDAYQEAAKKTLSENERLEEKKRKVDKVLKDISSIQREISDKKRKFNPHSQSNSSHSRRRDNYSSQPRRPTMNLKDMVYSPDNDSNDSTH